MRMGIRKDISMKKWTIVMAAGVMFCMVSCGQAPETEENASVTVQELAEDIEETDIEETDTGESATGDIAEDGTSDGILEDKAAADEIKGAGETDDTILEGNTEENPVVIEFEEESGSSPEEDTTHSYTYSYQRPVVTIAGNEDAAKKIQESIDAEVESFLSYVGSGALGEIYEEGGPVEPSYDDLTVSVMRADGKVISLQFMDAGYNGGAHGWANVSYRNYFTSTGEEITFADLGENFRERAIELVLEKANKMQEEEAIFSENYADSIPLVVLDGTEDMNEIYATIYDWWDEESALEDSSSNPTYYITEDSFVFVSGQYVLQPYVGGIIDIEIPREEFGDACTDAIF